MTADLPPLADITAWLQASLCHGTPIPWHAPTMSAERRGQLDAAARVERLERSTVAPGEHPAPMRLDILDLLDEAHTLADYGTADVDTEEFRRRALQALGLLADGQLLDALCPWCGGRTTRNPVGGERTLRVRYLPAAASRRHTAGAPAQQLQTGRLAVVCEGVGCEPPEGDFGITLRGRPAWPLDTEGDWLAQRIEHADRRREQARLDAEQLRRAGTQVSHMLEQEVDGAGVVCRCGQPVRRQATGRPARFCSPGCRKAAWQDGRAVQGSVAS